MELDVQHLPGLNQSNTSTELENAAPRRFSVRARSGCSPAPPASSSWEGNLGRQAGSKSELLWPASQQAFETALKPSEIPSPVPISLRDDKEQCCRAVGRTPSVGEP